MGQLSFAFFIEKARHRRAFSLHRTQKTVVSGLRARRTELCMAIRLGWQKKSANSLVILEPQSVVVTALAVYNHGLPFADVTPLFLTIFQIS